MNELELRREDKWGYHDAMPGSGASRLGPIARKLICPDVWTDGYPGPDVFIKELDVLLRFADERGCLERFRPNLEARNKQRDKALNELRLAYLFDSLDFPILLWDPPGASGRRIGEFLLDSPEKTPIFVEIKSPGWESELSLGKSQRDGRSSRNMKNLVAEPSETGKQFTDALRRLKRIQSSRQRNRIC